MREFKVNFAAAKFDNRQNYKPYHLSNKGQGLPQNLDQMMNSFQHHKTRKLESHVLNNKGLVNIATLR